MKAKNYFIIGSMLLVLTSFSNTSKSKKDTIITRHDTDEAAFFKLAKRFEKYICHLNLPDCEGTIIADQWVVTAAHCATGIAEKFKNKRKHFVSINDVEIEVDKVIMHKEWENPSILTDMTPLNDIALLHLKRKPIGAKQAKLYTDKDEVDKIIYMLGKGDIGNGLTGVNGNDGKLRGVTNRIETATGKWLSWTFDHPNTKTKYLTEFEGISGPGDSGGPAFIVKNGDVYLAGVSSWQDTKDGPEGLYGVVENYTRVSHYINWIYEEMKGNTSKNMLRIQQHPNAIDYRPKAIYVNPKTLQQYVGEFKTQNTTIKIYTKANGTKLYLSVPNQPEYELIPTAKHQFTFKADENYKVKFKNIKNGVLQELIAIQPDGTATATRK